MCSGPPPPHTCPSEPVSTSLVTECCSSLGKGPHLLYGTPWPTAVSSANGSIIRALTRLRARRLRNTTSILGGGKRCVSYLQIGFGAHPFCTGDYFSGRGGSDRGVKLTARLHLVPRLRTRADTPPLPHTASCCREEAGDRQNAPMVTI
jgi:hypothetical protein